MINDRILLVGEYASNTSDPFKRCQPFGLGELAVVNHRIHHLSVVNDVKSSVSDKLTIVGLEGLCF